MTGASFRSLYGSIFQLRHSRIIHVFQAHSWKKVEVNPYEEFHC